MDLVYLLEELQTIARNGLTYTRDVYDKERYEKLLELSTQMYSDLSLEFTAIQKVEELLKQFCENTKAIPRVSLQQY